MEENASEKFYRCLIAKFVRMFNIIPSDAVDILNREGATLQADRKPTLRRPRMHASETANRKPLSKERGGATDHRDVGE